MKSVLIAVVAAITLFTITESLTCKKCPVGVFGLCLFPTTDSCTGNSTVCMTSTATFSAISSFSGFSSSGCALPSQCNSTTNGTILGSTYTISQTCCSTDNCNPTNAAPYMQFSISAALSTSLLALVWAQSVY